MGTAEIRSDVLLWTSTYGHTSVGRPAETNIHPLSVDTLMPCKGMQRHIGTYGERETRGVFELSARPDNDKENT